MGYASYADYALADRMARTPAAVARLLEQVWAPARKRAAERARCARGDGAHRTARTAPIEPWDWRYYAEKVRAGALRPRRRGGQALLRARAHGRGGVRLRAAAVRHLRSSRAPTSQAYHPDVRVYEVRGADDRVIGLFLHDNFARPTKRSGAWMSSYRKQSRDCDGDVLPIIVNNNNFAKGAPGEPTLLSLDDARTLFHEFGHGLHGLLSQVTYERLSGTQRAARLRRAAVAAVRALAARARGAEAPRAPLSRPASRCRMS